MRLICRAKRFRPHFLSILRATYPESTRYCRNKNCTYYVQGKNNLLPVNIQQLFTLYKSVYVTRQSLMFASSHSKRTTPSVNDKLNTLASGILICSTVYISSFGGIPSTPGDLLSFIAFIFLATISGVTINCPKYSDLAS